MDVKTIVTLASYGVGGVVLVSLIATSPFHALLLAASAGTYFYAQKML